MVPAKRPNSNVRRASSPPRRDAGKPAELLVGDNFSHMETPETLCNPYGLLGAAVLKMT